MFRTQPVLDDQITRIQKLVSLMQLCRSEIRLTEITTLPLEHIRGPSNRDQISESRTLLMTTGMVCGDDQNIHRTMLILPFLAKYNQPS